MRDQTAEFSALIIGDGDSAYPIPTTLTIDFGPEYSRTEVNDYLEFTLTGSDTDGTVQISVQDLCPYWKDWIENKSRRIPVTLTLEHSNEIEEVSLTVQLQGSKIEAPQLFFVILKSACRSQFGGKRKAKEIARERERGRARERMGSFGHA